jgi:hypothetical protein
LFKQLLDVPAFALGYVGSAFLLGGVGGGFIDTTGIWVLGATLGSGALVASLICWWWPGFDGVWWKLYLIALVANPVVLMAVVWSVISFECLVGNESGWNCMLSGAGLDAIGACLPLPLLGLAARWLSRRRMPPS